MPIIHLLSQNVHQILVLCSKCLLFIKSSKYPDQTLNLHFVTSNPSKFQELSELLEIKLSHIELNLQEIQTTNLHELVKFKLRQAYAHVQEPVIVEDTSLYFEAWNELPGPLVKFFLKNIGLSGMVSLLNEFSNKTASATCCLGFTKDGKNIQLFEGKIKGFIVNPRGSQHFGWDAIFLPEKHQKTFGEMSSQEKHQISPRGVAAKKFKHFSTLWAKQK